MAADFGAEAFFSAGFDEDAAGAAGLADAGFAAAFGAGAGVFEDPAAGFVEPDAAAGADAGFFFSSFLGAVSNQFTCKQIQFYNPHKLLTNVNQKKYI